jgi:hypothetical protein
VRLYPGGVIPQNVNVADGQVVATWEIIGGTPSNTLSDRAPVDRQRITVAAWAKDYDAAEAAADVIRTALEDFNALAAQGASCIPDNENPPAFDVDSQLFNASRDYILTSLR